MKLLSVLLLLAVVGCGEPKVVERYYYLSPDSSYVYSSPPKVDTSCCLNDIRVVPVDCSEPHDLSFSANRGTETKCFNFYQRVECEVGR